MASARALLLLLALAPLALGPLCDAARFNKLVAAHRGASGYLPEHTLESKALAFQMGADYLEQDVVMSQDGVLLVMHDYFLDGITDVAWRFPGRARADGRYYVTDFTWAEVRQLNMTDPFTVVNGVPTPNRPARFPTFKSSFQIHTLKDEIEFIQGLIKTTGRRVGLYLEIKKPWLFRHEGLDISLAVLTLLKQYGYTSRASPLLLQCFDPNELERIRNTLLPSLGMDLRLVQLMLYTQNNETRVYDNNGVAIPYNTDWMLLPGGMARIATYAQGVGPWMPMVVDPVTSTPSKLNITQLVRRAHAARLVVHPFTFRKDVVLPTYARSFNDLMEIFLFKAGADGLFIDQPDLAVRYLANRKVPKAKGKGKGRK